MSGVGNILQGIGSIFSGISAKNAYYAKADALNKAAVQTGYEAAAASELDIEAGRRQAGQLLVNAAASGAGTTGSTLDVLHNLEQQIAFQARNTVISGMNKSRNYQFEATQAKKQGNVALTTGFINAGASFLNASDASKGS